MVSFYCVLNIEIEMFEWFVVRNYFLSILLNDYFCFIQIFNSDFFKFWFFKVLLQREPSLLTEFGGPIKLTTNWGKSFLKRMGINRLNTHESDGCSSNPQTNS